jgi:hypothetical protein
MSPSLKKRDQKTQLKTLMKPLENPVKTILEKALAHDPSRSRIKSSLQTKGSILQLLIPSTESRQRLSKELDNTNRLGKREFHFLTEIFWNELTGSIGVLGALVAMVFILPFTLFLDYIQLVLGLIVFCFAMVFITVPFFILTAIIACFCH